MRATSKTFLTWLITCLTGSFILGLILASGSGRFSQEFSEIFIIGLCLSGISSIPAMIAYHVIAQHINKYYSARPGSKVILAVCAILLTFFSAYLVSAILSRSFSGGGEWLNMVGLFATLVYGAPFAICVFLFNYSRDQQTAKLPEESYDKKIIKKLLAYITLVAGIPFLYALPGLISAFHLPWLYAIPNWIHIVAVPLGIYFLWKRHKTGWALLLLFPISNIIGIITKLTYIISANPKVLLELLHLSWLLTVTLNTLLLWLLNKLIIRNYLGITDPFRLTAIAVSIAISLVLSFIVMDYFPFQL